MNELALFAGAGGGILAGHLLGWTTVAAVEIEEYPRSVLLQRQRDGILSRFPVWDDIRTFDGKPWRGQIDIITGGFPCQDISAAGKGAGITGEHSGLWSEMARVVREVRPRFVFVENSSVLTVRGLGTVLGDLASMGYDARWCVLGAHDAGAPHKRDRIWILAYSGHRSGRNFRKNKGGYGLPGKRPADTNTPIGSGKQSKIMANSQEIRRGERNQEHGGLQERERPPGERSGPSDSSEVSDSDGIGKQQSERSQSEIGGWIGDICWWDVDPAELPDSVVSGLSDGRQARGQAGEEYVPHSTAERYRLPWWPAESRLGRVANGVARRVDRIKSIGNGQVPAVAAIAFVILSEGLM